MFLPSALKTDVIPIFFPNNPGISVVGYKIFDCEVAMTSVYVYRKGLSQPQGKPQPASRRPPSRRPEAPGWIERGFLKCPCLCAVLPKRSSDLDFNLHTRGKLKLHEGVHGLGGGVIDINETLE